MRIDDETRVKKIRKIYLSSAIALIGVLIAFYPRLIEAAQGTCRTVRLLTSDFSDANGPYQPHQYLSIKAADVDGDGTEDLCYRDVPVTGGFFIGGGIRCRTSSSGWAWVRWSRQFGSSWSGNEAYWRTIQYPDLNADGKKDICGRGSAGIICALSNGSSFWMPGSSIFSDGTTVWSSTFSDANGWATDPAYWKTIQFPDLNNDGKADVCGHASTGIYCALSNGTSFGPATQWDSAFGSNWSASPSYWSTIGFADVTGDGRPDVCGRYFTGIWCAQNNGSAFTSFGLWTSYFNNWSLEQNYATLQLADVNGDGKADICGRAGTGIHCGRSTGSAFVDTSFLEIADFSDAGGWNNERFYKSIRLIDADGDLKADVCGRGFAGILCASSGWTAQGYPTSGINPQTGIPYPDPTISFAPVRLIVPNYGDVDGFGASESYWGTVQPHRTAVLMSIGGFPAFPTHSVQWIGRGYAGIYISEYDAAECPYNP